MSKPRTHHLPNELMLLDYRLQKVRQALATTTELLFQMEHHIHNLRGPFMARKRNPTTGTGAQGKGE